jgi:hypothetical protein
VLEYFFCSAFLFTIRVFLVSGQISEMTKPASGHANFLRNSSPQKRTKPLLPGSVDFLHFYHCVNPNFSPISNSDVCDVIMWPDNVIDANRTTIYLRIAHFSDLGFGLQKRHIF